MVTYLVNLLVTRRKSEKGFTLLEYCAGAAVIIGIVYVALQAMGTGLSDFLRAIGTWASNRGGEINP